MRDLLREYLRLVLSEAAKPIGDLALDITKDKNGTTSLTLWNPGPILTLLEMTQDPEEVLNELSDSGNVYAFMSMLPHRGEAWNAWEVRASVAVKGYGPTMYDIAMSKFKRITSDRESVSNAAEKVWRYYANRRSDVKKLPFDNKYDPQTPPKEDDAQLHSPDEEVLNNAYEGAHVDTAAAELRSRQVIAQLADALEVDAKQVLEALHQGAWNFFDQNYEPEE